jgi:hypothetical protein
MARRTSMDYIPIPPDQRDELILTLRRRGASLKRIAQAVGMTPSGVRSSLIRIAEGKPGRPPR